MAFYFLKPPTGTLTDTSTVQLDHDGTIILTPAQERATLQSIADTVDAIFKKVGQDRFDPKPIDETRADIATEIAFLNEAVPSISYDFHFRTFAERLIYTTAATIRADETINAYKSDWAATAQDESKLKDLAERSRDYLKLGAYLLLEHDYARPNILLLPVSPEENPDCHYSWWSPPQGRSESKVTINSHPLVTASSPALYLRAALHEIMHDLGEDFGAMHAKGMVMGKFEQAGRVWNAHRDVNANIPPSLPTLYRKQFHEALADTVARRITDIVMDDEPDIAKTLTETVALNIADIVMDDGQRMTKDEQHSSPVPVRKTLSLEPA